LRLLMAAASKQGHGRGCQQGRKNAIGTTHRDRTPAAGGHAILAVVTFQPPALAFFKKKIVAAPTNNQGQGSVEKLWPKPPRVV
jgi:hypothetical protein